MRFRIIFLVLSGITIVGILAPLLLGFASATITYRGTCYGFTDGSWPCSWLEYVSDQVFWSALLAIPVSMYLFPTWLIALVLWLYRRHTTAPNRLPLPLVFLIPAGGYFIGFGLISILPVFIRFFNWIYR